MTPDWETKPLGEVCDLVLGKTPARGSREYWDTERSSGNVWVSIADMSAAGESITDSKEYVSDLGASLWPPVSPGTLLMSFKLSIGKVAFAGVRLRTNEAIVSFENLSVALDKRYLYYYLMGFDWDALTDGQEKVKGRTLNKAKLAIVPVTYPPLEEQKRIVAILDVAFAGLDAAQANTEQVATDGEDLFQEGLERVLTPPKNDWAESQLGSVTTKIGSGATPRGGEKAYKTSGTSLIRSLNVHDSGFRHKRLAFIDASQASMLSNVEVQEGDVLLNITGASVARCCIVDGEILPARVNQHVSIIRPVPDVLDPEFLHYLLTSRTCKSRLLGIGEGAGSTRQAITKAQIEGFTIRYPVNLSDQRRIVQEISELRSHAQHLGRVLDRKLANITDLRQSLLHQAFSGQL